MKGTEYKAKAEGLKATLTRYHELEKSVKEKREELRKVSEKYEQVMVIERFGLFVKEFF